MVAAKTAPERRGGHGHVRDSSDLHDPGLYRVRGRSAAGRRGAQPAAGILIILVLLNSLLACANGAGNSGSRMLFSLGRVGGLPSSFANIDKKRGTPYFAIRVISISGIITAVGLGFIIGGPLNVFAVYATAITILFVVAYMLVAVFCIRFSIREPEKSGNFLLRRTTTVFEKDKPATERQALQEP